MATDNRNYERSRNSSFSRASESAMRLGHGMRFRVTGTGSVFRDRVSVSVSVFRDRVSVLVSEPSCLREMFGVSWVE
jgi:hypothetical protein